MFGDAGTVQHLSLGAFSWLVFRRSFLWEPFRLVAAYPHFYMLFQAAVPNHLGRTKQHAIIAQYSELHHEVAEEQVSALSLIADVVYLS